MPGAERRVPSAWPGAEEIALGEIQRARRLVADALSGEVPSGPRGRLGMALAALQNAEMFLTGDPG